MCEVDLNSKHVSAIILAAGTGTRMKSKVTKQQMKILGESVLVRSVRAFQECDLIDSIVVVAKEDEISVVSETLASDFSKLYSIVPGGNFRAESAKRGFMAIPNDADYVAIHDAARCLVTPDIIKKVVVSALEYGAATASCAITDTVKRVNLSVITETVPRSELVAVQTPQIFKKELYEKALDLYSESTLNDLTDDNMLLERLGAEIYCVDTGKENMKITTQYDIELAEFILERRK